MPSKTKRQSQFMAAQCSKPTRVPRKVACEFKASDKGRKKGK